MIHQEVEVLIVEDNDEDAELAIRALKKHRLANNVVHLSDGEQALDFIFGRGNYLGRVISQLPKVILLDIKMPKVSGLQVLQAVKSDPQMKVIPVVILTSSEEDPDIRKAYELGANSYIVKPVEFDNFSKTVADLGLYWMVVNRI
ncbi:Response regulator receiver domain-containing protein [Chryseolinea serpens]|uniref:Response regulator receiver domain-containing protein n=2 Tax=Chryseolinea serpens TaxID=947013 RepID=A0A1M5ML55_9BACT|nr:Response regulator receiver domain-containing protein [Chryseolinea serpens]